MNIDAYNARPLIAQAIAEERSRIIAELTDVSWARGATRVRGTLEDRVVSLVDAISIVRDNLPDVG